jgi:two-component system cell cycle sensor histidine kinase/response regulator CckA
VYFFARKPGRPLKQKSFNSLLVRAVGIPVIALALFSALLLWEIQSLKSSLGWLDHTDQVISADRELIKLNLDMETGVRGYLDTGNEEFLQPYNAAAPVMDLKFAGLHQLVSDNPAQQAQLANIQTSFNEWRLLADQTVASRRADIEHRKSQKSAYVDSLQLKQLMDSIRAKHDSFITTERGLQSIATQRSSGVSRLAIITCTILVSVGGAAFALFIRHEMRLLDGDFKLSLGIAQAHAEALQEQAALLDLAYDTIIVRGLEGTIRFWNHGAEQTYGYSKQQATGQTSQDLLRTVFPEPLASIEEKLKRDGRWEGELQRTRYDGSQVTVATRWVPQLDKNGQACGVMEVSSDITIRKQNEEELRERELLLRTVAEQTDIGLVVLSEERRYLYSNPAHSEALGLTSEEIVGRRVADVMGESYNQISNQLDKAFAGERVDFEIRGPTRPGKVNSDPNHLYAITYKPLNRPGKGTRVIAVVIDITERKRGIEALRVSQERLSAIIGMAMDAVITLDANQHIVLFNPAAEKAFGCSAKQAMGQSLDQFIPGQFQIGNGNHGQASGNKGTTGQSMHSAEMFFGLHVNYGVRTNGEKFPLEGTISQITVADERLYTIILRDITQRKQAEEQLREKEERFRTMFEHAAVGIAQVAMDGKCLMVNPVLCEMLGFSENELLSRTTQSITHADDWQRENWMSDSMLSGDCDFYEIEKRFVHRSGAAVWVNATSSLVKDDQQRGLYSIKVVQDITQRKRAEDQLQQAQKMEAIGRLAGGVAHDFNNLLTVIMGYSELALSELPESDPNRARFEQIESAAEAGAALTKQLLAFSRKRVIAKEVVDLKEIVIGMEPMLHRLLHEDIEMTVCSTQDACPVEADPSQLKQVLINLVVNAGDAMPRGGALKIDVRGTELTHEEEQNLSIKPGAFEVLTVTDNGSGMDAATVAHIFEPFFTTKPVGEGTGLGLATLFGIVKQWGGAVSVSSTPGAGSIFKVYLPRSSHRSSTKGKRNRRPQRVVGTETVLVVDDSAPLRELLQGILSREGYNVLDAADGLQAWELSRSYLGKIHLLITDMVMPHMGGTELAEHIVHDRPHIALIFVTGYLSENDVIPDCETGRIAIVEKPYRPDALLQTVRRILDETPK